MVAEETELVLRATRGDADAFGRLVLGHRPRIRVLLHRLLTTSEIDDAEQEVFLAAWWGIGRYRGDASLATWLTRIAVNRAYRILSRRAKRPVVLEREPERQRSSGSGESPPDEAMGSGLPVFATWLVGPFEIIEDGVRGFHIDPNHGDVAAEEMAGFFARCREDPEEWSRVSDAAMMRVGERYTWRLYAERMMTLSRVYGFWKYVTDLERAETRRYLEMFHALQFRPRAALLLDD